MYQLATAAVAHLRRGAHASRSPVISGARRAGIVAIALATACGPAPVAPSPTAPGSAPPSAVPTSAGSAPGAVPVPIPCATALAKDTTGENLPPAYAQLAQSIEDAACHHDYPTLESLMAPGFTYDVDGSRGSPDEVVATWRSTDPTDSNLRRLAKALTAPAAYKQGTYTIRSGGATVIFQNGQWTGFF